MSNAVCSIGQSALRKMLVLLAAALAATALLATSAQAGGSPHFIKNATGTHLDGTSLVAEFKEAGLAAGSTETITLSANESIAYECVNGGDKNPAASNKQVFSETTSTSGEFTADKNGNLVGSLRLDPASAQSLGFSCPPGQKVTFVSVSYSNVTIEDEDSGTYASYGGSFSYTNPNAPAPR